MEKYLLVRTALFTPAICFIILSSQPGVFEIRPLLMTQAPSMCLCKDLIVDNLEDCRICEVRYLCGGACRARAFHATGRIDAADEFCSYEYRAFLEGIFRAYKL